MDIKNSYEDGSVSDLFSKLRRHLAWDNPRDDYSAVEECLGILKLYYDGIYEKEQNSLSYFSETRHKNEKQTLEELLSGCKSIVGRVHSGSELLPSDLRQVLSLEDKVTKYASDGQCGSRHLNKGYPIQELVSQLERIRDKKGDFDSVFYVASGGAEPALLYCARNGGIPTPIRFSNCRLSDGNVAIPKSISTGYLKEKIRGKRVLLVEDVMISGLSIGKVIEYISKYKPKELYGCVVCGDWRNLSFKDNLDDLYKSYDGVYIFRVKHA